MLYISFCDSPKGAALVAPKLAAVYTKLGCLPALPGLALYRCCYIHCLLEVEEYWALKEGGKSRDHIFRTLSLAEREFVSREARWALFSAASNMLEIWAHHHLVVDASRALEVSTMCSLRIFVRFARFREGAFDRV